MCDRIRPCATVSDRVRAFSTVCDHGATVYERV